MGGPYKMIMRVVEYVLIWPRIILIIILVKHYVFGFNGFLTIQKFNLAVFKVGLEFDSFGFAFDFNPSKA